MKHDEEFCHSALMRFLSQTCSVESRPGTEPPDFYLYWNGKEFAVEITSLVELVPNPETTEFLPKLTVERALTSFISKIESRARKKGILDGKYLADIHIDGPILNFNLKKTKLAKAINRHIDETRKEKATPYLELYRDVNVHIKIKKYSENGARIDFIITSDAKWHNEILSHAQCLLQRAINAKRDQLINEPQPKILLLLNRFLLASIHDFKEALPLCSGKEFFHAIFLVTCDGDVYQLK